MRIVFAIVIVIGLVFAMWKLPAMDQGASRVPPDTQPRLLQGMQGGGGGELPPGHPPIGGQGGGAATGQAGASMGQGSATMGQMPGGDMTASAAAAEEGVPLPLKLEGSGSLAELKLALERLSNPADRERFENAYRLTFTTDRQGRDYARAREIFDALLESHPDLAEAYRGLAYAEFNTTMNFPRTVALYEKAIQIDPDYGEAHYALAFMLGSSDPERGAEHLRRAMELGVDDERNLRSRFYPDAR